MRALLLIISLIISSFLMAEDKNKPTTNIVYKYKKYESFDLGDLEIKGNIIAPGDLSVKERDRKKFNRALLNRKSFDREVTRDIKGLR